MNVEFVGEFSELSFENVSFADCTSLKTIALPSGTVKLNMNVFLRNTNMTSIYLPNTITTMWDENFCKVSTNFIVYYEGSEIPSTWYKEWDYLTNSGTVIKATVVFNATYEDYLLAIGSES